MFIRPSRTSPPTCRAGRHRSRPTIRRSRGKGDFKKHKPPEEGFLDLDESVVLALSGAGLTWGGTYPTDKDIMHFDLREAEGAKIHAARTAHVANLSDSAAADSSDDPSAMPADAVGSEHAHEGAGAGAHESPPGPAARRAREGSLSTRFSPCSGRSATGPWRTCWRAPARCGTGWLRDSSATTRDRRGWSAPSKTPSGRPLSARSSRSTTRPRRSATRTARRAGTPPATPSRRTRSPATQW